MAEKELAVLLTAKNMASGPINKVKGDISTLDRVAGRAGKGIRTIGTNLKTIGAGLAVGGVALGIAAIKSGLDSLAEREGVISATNAAIRAQGKDAKVTAGEIRNWSEELERATGAAVDDKAIQASANTLIRFGVLSHDTFQRALRDATDLGAGLKTGPEAGAKLLGKALADPAKAMGALKKAGIVLTDAETKRIKQLIKGNKVQAAQVVLLEAVEKRYKGAAKASAGPYQRALNLLADASEDAKMALAEGFLPVLEKVADKLSTGLSDPKTMDAIRSGGKAVAGFLDDAFEVAAKIPWGSIADAMQMAGTGAKAIFDVFAGLPPWVQTAVLTGWGLNKLSGGAIGGIVGELGKGLIKGVLGMNAGVVNINAGVVNGGGGIGGAAGTAAGVGTGLAAGLIGASVAASVIATQDLLSKTTLEQRRREGGLRVLSTQAPKEGPVTPGLVGNLGRNAPDRRGVDSAIMERATKAGFRPSADAIQRTFERNTARSVEASRQAAFATRDIETAYRSGTAQIVAAIKGIKLSVNVTASDVQKAQNTRRRAVRAQGNRNSLVGANEFG